MFSVFLAFFCTRITNFSARLAEQNSVFAANSHQARRCIAGFRTLAI
jgi:hypothetical protein